MIAAAAIQHSCGSTVAGSLLQKINRSNVNSAFIVPAAASEARNLRFFTCFAASTLAKSTPVKQMSNASKSVCVCSMIPPRITPAISAERAIIHKLPNSALSNTVRRSLSVQSFRFTALPSSARVYASEHGIRTVD